MTETDTLPDDPRDCCRAAIGILIDEDLINANMRLRSTIDILYTMSLGDGVGFDVKSVMCAQNWLLHEAQEALDLIQAATKQVSALVRHGTTDRREMDRWQAERLASIGER